MASRTAAQKRLQAKLDRLTPALRREVEAAFAALQRKVPVERLIDAIERGDLFALQVIAANLPASLRGATETLAQAFALGANAAKAALSTRLVFDAADPATAAIAARSSAALVTNVTAETRKAIRSVVSQAFRERITVRETAKLIKPMIGLTDRQALAVLKRRQTLINAGLKPAAISKDLARYTATLLKQRAEMIARTEIQRANTEGQLSAWRAARDQGLLSANLAKVWIVTPDDRLCPQCEPLDGQQAALDGTFETGIGRVDGPPLHPLCRCALGLVQATKRARRAA